MTANQMRNLFKQLYDGASAQEMGYDDTEVSRFLNLAQILIINEKHFANRNRLGEGFEIGSKREIELNDLKRSATVWFDPNTDTWEFKNYAGDMTFTVTMTNDFIMNLSAVMFEIPTEILYIENDSVDLDYNGTLVRNINVKNVNEDNLASIFSNPPNPFAIPDRTVAYRTVEKLDSADTNKTIKLIIDSTAEFKRWNVTYIKRPIDIVIDILTPNNAVDCELDEIIHNDIVFKAVELALGAIGSEKTQLAILNTNKNVN